MSSKVEMRDALWADDAPGHIRGHLYLRTTEDVTVHRTMGYSHHGRYYGSSKIYDRVTDAVILPAGSEVHRLPGGWFALDGDEVYAFSPRPADAYDGHLPEEDEYLRLFDGKADIIAQRREVGRYPTKTDTLPDFIHGTKEVIR